MPLSRAALIPVGTIFKITLSGTLTTLHTFVIPYPTLGYLALWPDGQQQPVVSTLNAVEGAITSHMAIVPTTNGKIDAFANNGLTQLPLDISSYFAP